MTGLSSPSPSVSGAADIRTMDIADIRYGHLPFSNGPGFTRPANPLCSAISVVLFRPLPNRSRGRAALQFRIVSPAFRVGRCASLVNNEVIAARLTGPARWISQAPGPDAPPPVAVRQFALAVMIPTAFLGTCLIASRLRGERAGMLVD